MNSTRIDRRFAELRKQGRAAFIPFITAGDPDAETSFEVLKGLPGAGADIIELGMPFSDPMAEGPSIQHSSQRALEAGASLRKTLSMVARFRETDSETPIILMGYYNPIYRYGVEKFVPDAVAAGVDGLIVVDLPAEADSELCVPALNGGLNFIRLATPTTDDKRLPVILANTSGFVYYVSITGITGTASANMNDVANAVARIQRHTDLPVAVGFGIKQPEHVAEVARFADGAVVGSAIVDRIAAANDAGKDPQTIAQEVHAFVRELASGVGQT